MQCAALASSTGSRCKLDARPGHRTCEYHAGAAVLVAGDEPQTPDTNTPSGPAPSALDELEQLEAAPDPEQEPAAAPRNGPELGRADEIPADLFSSSEPEPAPAAAASSATQPPPLEGGTLLERHPGRFNASTGRRLLEGPCNRLFRKAGWDELEPQEAESGGEVIAAFLNRAWEDLDPANPMHALMLWVAVVVGPRALPSLAMAAGRRAAPAPPAAEYAPAPTEDAAAAENAAAGLGPWARLGGFA